MSITMTQFGSIVNDVLNQVTNAKIVSSSNVYYAGATSANLGSVLFPTNGYNKVTGFAMTLNSN
jgi:hypothetical protein